MRYLVLLLFASSLSGQNYFSHIIPFDENPFPFILVQENANVFHIASLNFVEDISTTSILTFDSDLMVVQRMDLIGQKLARKSLYKSHSGYVAFGNDEDSSDKDEFYTKMSDSFEIEIKSSTTTPSTRSGAISSIFIEDHLYGSSRDVINGDQTDPNYCYQSTIFKFDTLGNEIWQRNYGQEGNYTFMYELDKSLDGHLLAAANHSKPGPSNSSALMMKLDDDGNIIWRYESDEEPDNGASPVYVEQLSNGTYLQGYPVWKPTDDEYAINNWSIFPWRFRWVDDNGLLIKKKMLTYKRRDVVSIRGIERGNGDYFFGYGFYQERDDVNFDIRTYAMITKFDNEGDTIWTGRYKHPNHQDLRIRNTVTDIIEEENGDIVVLCHIDYSNEQDKIWLFRLNENGCVEEEVECTNQVLVSTLETLPINYSLKPLVYPNPFTETINILVEKKTIQRISVTNQLGQNILNRSYNSSYVELDLTQYNGTLFNLLIEYSDGYSEVIRVLKN